MSRQSKCNNAIMSSVYTCHAMSDSCLLHQAVERRVRVKVEAETRGRLRAGNSDDISRPCQEFDARVSLPSPLSVSRSRTNS